MNHPLDRVGPAALTLQWRLRRQTLYLYEIDTDAVAALVPEPLSIVEVRPDVALFMVECLHYYPGHFRPDAPESFELVLAVPVQPNLSIDMPVPRLSLHIVSVITSSLDFVENESRAFGSPIVHAPDLRMEFTADGANVDVLDGKTPIVRQRNTNPEIAFEPKVLWGLTFTNTRGVQQGIFRWEGQVFEHMKRGDHGTFHPHEVYKGIDTGKIRGINRQMVAKPDVVTDVRYYHLGAVEQHAPK
jgi:hypothetical protein